MACCGHLTQVTSQEGTECGQGGADVPDLNLRLVGDFISWHDSMKTLTWSCSQPQGGVVPIPSKVEDSVMPKADSKSGKPGLGTCGISCTDTHTPDDQEDLSMHSYPASSLTWSSLGHLGRDAAPAHSWSRRVAFL